jgi:photosystem II stability/assembly factor-like uncharacterized protein
MMKILKNPILWVVVLVFFMVAAGYMIMLTTSKQQEAIKRKIAEKRMVLKQYDLFTMAVKTSPFEIWAAGSGGMVVRSLDEGKSWEEKQLGSPEVVFSSIHFPDPDHGWLVGTRSAIYNTEDGGKTWNKIDRKDNMYLTSVFFADVQHGWITGEMGTVLLTANGGKTWETIDTGLFLTTLNEIKFIDQKTGWAVGEQGVVIFSSDGGRTWRNQQSGTGKSLMSVFPTSASTVWAGGLEGTVLLTKDGGKNWQKKVLTFGENTITNHVNKILEQKSGTEGVESWVEGQHNQIYALCRGAQQYSFDGGYSWRPIMMDKESGELLRRGFLHDIRFHPEKREFGWMVGKWGVILRTVDAQNWERIF